MRTSVTRLAFIDAFKAIASQLIVLHHLAFYGPMSDVAQEMAPTLFSWLSQDARIAVQVFLVIGGFLAAKALAPTARLLTPTPLAMLRRRYFKLVVPYAAAILLSVLCAAAARQLNHHDSIPSAPTLPQFLAHIALLQSVLDVDSLSAGVWYIAIDFQLFALMLGLLWLARASSRRAHFVPVLGVALVAVVAAASLFYFNRNATWDSWALYFFGAYALGALTFWFAEAEFLAKRPAWLIALVAVVISALLIDFRSRIAVALITALALGLAHYRRLLGNWPDNRLLAYLGKISYSVFLAHFPVILVINAVITRLSPDDPAINAFGILCAWIASIGSGALFYRFIESGSGRYKEVLVDRMLRLIGRLELVHRTKS